MSLRDLAAKAKSKPPGRRGRLLTVNEIRRIRRKGYRAERQLVKKFRRYGFKAVRIPVSAPSSEPLPDVFATKGDTLIAFEIKASTSDNVYFHKAQIKKLFDFLGMFEAYTTRKAVLGAKFPYRWTFRQVQEIDDYVIRKEEKSNITFR